MTFELTQSTVKELLSYDAESGQFFRLQKTKRSPIGQIKTSVLPTGYVMFSIKGRKYLAHRIAWLYVYGYFPAKHIDHIDGCKSNNAIANLRSVTRSLNMQNQRKPHTGKGLPLGVHMHGNRFKAVIKTNGLQKHIGVFKTQSEASSAYISAKRQLHEGNTL